MPETTSSASSPECSANANGHPLEIIPFFRRFRRSFARDILYTAIWNTLFAIFFFALGALFDTHAPLSRILGNTFIFAQSIGFAIYFGFFAGDRLLGARLARASKSLRTLYFATIPVVCVFPGYLFALRLLGWDQSSAWGISPRDLLSLLLLALVITGLMLAIFIPRERAARAEAAIANEQARVAGAEKEATKARMKLLEAQVEPHFLYNTLAHVVSLIDHEPSNAKGIIERLIVLLRASASPAAGRGTLGAQVALLRAYLDIVELRMGARLTWRIDMPASLADIEVSPMLLQPIVENAVKHGLEPSVAGVEITIAARREGSILVLSVADTGRGFRATTMPRATPGIGLANLRARLAAAYGDAASLMVEDVLPHGSRVTIAVPLASEPGPDKHGQRAFAAAS
jgi:signal transduction histidine kinase